MYSYSDQLLLKYTHSNNKWETNDSESLYQTNLKRQPADWYYRNNSVNYSWNSNGYRAPEWDTIDWQQSHVLMGCSYAMGSGVDDCDTISSQVPNGVNLGQSGTSLYAIEYNTIRMIDAGIRPLTVKIIMPNIARLTYWGDIDWIDLTPHDLSVRGDQLVSPVRECYAGWLSIKYNAEQHGYMAARAVQALWKSNGVPCDLYQHWAPENPVFNQGYQLPEPVDQARDINSNNFAHPGRDTFKLWADIMYGLNNECEQKNS
jgi:hypothetical protein